MPPVLGPSTRPQNLKSERYRLKLVVSELDSATATDYQIALLAFINCVVISAPTLQKRIKIRNEFIGEFRGRIGGNWKA